EELRAVASALKLEALTADWLPRFGQHARFEVSRHQTRISVWAADAQYQPREVHILFRHTWLLTVHAQVDKTMDQARTLFGDISDVIAPHPSFALMLVLNELLASFYPALEHVDEGLGQLEDEIFQAPDTCQWVALSAVRKYVGSLQRLWLPYRDTLSRLVVTIGGIPGMGEKELQTMRDYAERVADFVERIDDYRQRTNEALDSYSANISNQQATMINRLTLINGIFLPITVTTCFFGMNFNWMAVNMGTLTGFLVWGVGLNLGLIAGTLLLFWKIGWLGVRAASGAKPAVGPPALLSMPAPAPRQTPAGGPGMPKAGTPTPSPATAPRA
ncbi:MAG: hypothetical protein NTV22_17140, partial [bacterium]|nr:hypothetical protein [bacterium]